MNNIKLQILIHSAGIGIYKPLSEITQSDWNLSFSLNVEAPFYSQTNLTVNQVPHGFIGSNPILSTIYFGNHAAKIYCFASFMRTVGEDPDGKTE